VRLRGAAVLRLYLETLDRVRSVMSVEELEVAERAAQLIKEAAPALDIRL
jgi:hypothetical protein